MAHSPAKPCAIVAPASADRSRAGPSLGLARRPEARPCAATCSASIRQGSVCLDVGASTGGFTEVLLARGRSASSRGGCGHVQLHPKLKADSRVRVARAPTLAISQPEMLGEAPGLVVCDASFIGLPKCSTGRSTWLPPDAMLVGLFKPQFEVGPAHVGQGRHRHRPGSNRATPWGLRELAGFERLVCGWMDAQPHTRWRWKPGASVLLPKS